MGEVIMAQKIIQISLKDFIKSTLLDINNAVIEAKKDGIPITYNKYRNGVFPTAKTIEFDIAVQISENELSGKNSEGGLGISVIGFKFDKEGRKSLQHETTNRIKFSVDMFLGQENDKGEQRNG
jgi:hypothetical protein